MWYNWLVPWSKKPNNGPTLFCKKKQYTLIEQSIGLQLTVLLEYINILCYMRLFVPHAASHFSSIKLAAEDMNWGMNNERMWAITHNSSLALSAPLLYWVKSQVPPGLHTMIGEFLSIIGESLSIDFINYIAIVSQVNKLCFWC